MQIAQIEPTPDSKFPRSRHRVNGRPAREHDAHEEIVRRHGARLYRLAWHLTYDESEARDLVQDTFERSLRKLPVQLPEPRIRRWLLVTLRNRFVDLKRSSDRRVRVALDDTLLSAPPQEIDPEPDWAEIEPAQLWRCVDRLNPILREVFVLRVRERRPYAEIADRLGVPIATAGTRFFRALRHLRCMLEQELEPTGKARHETVRTGGSLREPHRAASRTVVLGGHALNERDDLDREHVGPTRPRARKDNLERSVHGTHS
jgi:RNA polymerase sigma-70 factor (ECF subfamily)